jgi:hypothetical protein
VVVRSLNASRGRCAHIAAELFIFALLFAPFFISHTRCLSVASSIAPSISQYVDHSSFSFTWDSLGCWFRSLHRSLSVSHAPFFLPLVNATLII